MLPGHIRGTLSRRAGGVWVYPKGPHPFSLFPSAVFICFPVPTQGSSWREKSMPHSPLCTSQRQRLSVQRLYFKKQNIILLPQGSWLSPLSWKKKPFLYVYWVAKQVMPTLCDFDISSVLGRNESMGKTVSLLSLGEHQSRFIAGQWQPKSIIQVACEPKCAEIQCSGTNFSINAAWLDVDMSTY